MIRQQDSQLLLMVAPGRVRRIGLRRDYTVIGRDPACDVWLDDPHVSRTHAALQRRGNAVYVTDLGSSGGTFVGGTAVTGPRELRPGDVVSFASVTARFEPAAGETLPGLRPAPVPGWRPPPACWPPDCPPDCPPPACWPRRAAARWLSWAGSLVLAEGAVIAFLVGRNGGAGLARYRLGPALAGVPAGLVGLALAGAGLLLLVTGAGLHIAASTGRRRLVRR